MHYLSLFSGIEAATAAWKPLGWTPIAFAEVDKAACAVLHYHYPDVPNFGDVEGYHDWPDMAPDLIIGGSPCQSFSIAGFRKGLADSRGNFALTFCGIIRRYRPRWVVWENVPGVLSVEGGRAFGSILRVLGELGYACAWRVLDAQYVRVDGFCRAVPQRRRRLFLVGHIGKAEAAGKVLFDTESGGRRVAPRRKAEKEDTGEVILSVEGFEVANTLTARMYKGLNTTLDEGHTPIVEVGDDATRVRVLTPVECERLQGFPDNYTLVPGPKGRLLSDTRRYQLIGNSMAVNVIRWIGMRIGMVDGGLL